MPCSPSRCRTSQDKLGRMSLSSHGASTHRQGHKRKDHQEGVAAPGPSIVSGTVSKLIHPQNPKPKKPEPLKSGIPETPIKLPKLLKTFEPPSPKTLNPKTLKTSVQHSVRSIASHNQLVPKFPASVPAARAYRTHVGFTA